MNIESVPIPSIIVGKRHREINDDAALQLAESMEKFGIQTPITLTRNVDGALVLVAGRHRLKAAEAIGWTHIDAVIRDWSPVEAELWEISENFHRLDLTKEQRDIHIRRYAELLREKEAEEVSRQNVAKPKSGPEGGRPEGIASKVAKETGLNVRAVQRALSEKKPAPKKAADSADIKTDEPKERAPNGLKELARAWLNASKEAREEFLERHDLMRKAKPKPPVITIEANKPAFRDIPPEKPDPATNAYAAAKNGDMRIIQPAGMPTDDEFIPERDAPAFLKKGAA